MEDHRQINKAVHLVKLHSMQSVLNRERLLTEFYHSFLSVFFPHQDQLDGLPVLLDALGKKDGFEGYCNLRVDLLFDRGKMVGGIVYELYSRSCCGLIAYHCVHPSYKKFDYNTLLMRAAEREIHEIALRLGHPFAKAIFCETNHPNGPLELGETVEERYAGFERMGYRHVDFPFVQPPLEENKQPSHSLLLLVSVNPPHRLLKAPGDRDGYRVPLALLRDWTTEYWNSVDADVSHSPDYHRVMAAFDEYKGDSVPLRSLLEFHQSKI